MNDTIFALSSGAPPAAIAVVRISGPAAASALRALAGALPPPRRASCRRLRDEAGDVLDHALVLWFPGPATATGEDLGELHLHGGRAVVAAIDRTLADQLGLRRAEPGEFTRRAFANGRIDLAEAEGLADLLTAETELQRRHAMALAGGNLSAKVHAWRDEVLAISAMVEAALDFSDEDDVPGLPPGFAERVRRLSEQLGSLLATPTTEALREGFRVVLAGPPNSGKSSLFNALIEQDAAITAPIAGTTRDLLLRPVAIAGVPFVFADTAGLRDETVDPIEAIGIERAMKELGQADLVLWMGEEGELEGRAVWEIETFADLHEEPAKIRARHRVSAIDGSGVDALRRDLVEMARGAMPGPSQTAINARQRQMIVDAGAALSTALNDDLLIAAEGLRLARVAFDRLLGRSATEDMLDVLFRRFCIGK